MEYVKVPKKVWEPIKSLVELGLYKDEKDALENLVHEQAEQKIANYKSKIERMEKLYGMSFGEFEKKIKSKKESFKEWDDYILWKGYEESLNYWKRIVEGRA
jgi:hypothetical protein